MTPKFTPCQRALAEAAAIADERAAACRVMLDRWEREYPNDALGAAIEKSAMYEASLVANKIRALAAKGRRRGGEERA
jgi:hypothetical protein